MFTSFQVWLTTLADEEDVPAFVYNLLKLSNMHIITVFADPFLAQITFHQVNVVVFAAGELALEFYAGVILNLLYRRLWFDFEHFCIAHSASQAAYFFVFH